MISRIEIRDEQLAAAAEFRMADDRTAQALGSALGATAARRLPGDGPPPAARRSRLHTWKPPARLVCSTMTRPWPSAVKSPTEIPNGRPAGVAAGRPPRPVTTRCRSSTGTSAGSAREGRLGHGPDSEDAAAAACGTGRAETEQVQVAVAAEHRRAEDLLRERFGPWIRFANPKGIDFPYLLSMLHGSFMSRPNIIVVSGGKAELAMQLIFTPLILRFMAARRTA